MANLDATLGGVAISEFTIPFLERPLENATDVFTLAGETYTDWVSQGLEWTINFKQLSKADYDALRDVYDDQFVNGVYPTFVLAYYSINTQVRMYINDKDIRWDGECVYNVSIRLVRAGVS